MTEPAATCPNCGAAITIRALQQTQTVVCQACHAVLDSRDQQLSILQAYQSKLTFSRDIPLGTRGTLRDVAYEVSGFQVRKARQNDTEYFWREYTLWNPFKGYRYLMEYEGHWTDFVVSRIAPSEMVTGRQPYVTFDGSLFRHFRTTTVTTEFILGEFAWQIRSGERVTSRDFIAPPRMLSEEVSPNATVWALGHTVPAPVIWHAFSLAGRPAADESVSPSEPNPHSAPARMGGSDRRPPGGWDAHVANSVRPIAVGVARAMAVRAPARVVRIPGGHRSGARIALRAGAMGKQRLRAGRDVKKHLVFPR